MKVEDHFDKVETFNKKVNINDLLDRNRSERKKEKKRNVVIAATAISAIAVTGLIISI
tara:strand:- start:12741 stop:12914 length:174 start_codon:yes stop_codon:yes gene_type:complete